MNKGKIIINKDRCKGCSLCVPVCPKKCIAMSGELNKRGVHFAFFEKKSSCIGCGLCAKVCPDLCIEVWKG